MNGRRFLVMALTSVSLVCASAPAWSGEPFLPNCYWRFTNDETRSMSLYNLPDGTGSDLADARYRDGSNGVVEAAIYVVIRDDVSAWVLDYPAEDIYLTTQSGGLVFCPGSPPIADGPTSHYSIPSLNLEWSTKFFGPFRSGGHTNPAAGDKVVVEISGAPLTPPTSDMQMNSADINGDLRVDLNDVVLFVHNWQPGPYDYRSDFVADNVINLSDVAVLARDVGTICQ